MRDACTRTQRDECAETGRTANVEKPTDVGSENDQEANSGCCPSSINKLRKEKRV
jgi:hypothetical protein